MHYDGNPIPSLLTCTICLARHNNLHVQSQTLAPITWTWFQVLRQVVCFIPLSRLYLIITFHPRLSFQNSFQTNESCSVLWALILDSFGKISKFFGA
jgi:hypothetical protein